MNANVPMLNEIAGNNTKEVIMVLNETIRQQQAEIEVLTKFLDETCQIGKFIVWNSTDKAQEK